MERKKQRRKERKRGEEKIKDERRGVGCWGGNEGRETEEEGGSNDLITLLKSFSG